MEPDTASAVAARGAQVVLSVWPWGLLTAAAAFWCAMGIQRMAGGLALRPLRRVAPGHWTEKARLAYPGWVTLILGQIFQPCLWFFFATVGPDNRSPGVAPMVALAAFIGAGVASARLESRVRERTVSMLEWLRGWVLLGLSFLAPCVVFCVLIWWLPSHLSWTVLWVALAYVGLVLVLSLGGILALLRGTGFLRRAPERLGTSVDAAVQRMGVTPPTAYVLRWRTATALAFPFGRVVAVTDTALGACTDEELMAVCSHELAHLSEPRRIHYARLAGQFAWLPLFLLGPLQGALGEGRGLLVSAGCCLVAHAVVRKMVLALEKRADAAAKAHEGETGAYARALQKLYEVNLMPAVLRSWLPTHPNLYDRLVAAGLTPDYPRPKPPSRWRARVALGLLLLGALFCAATWMGFLRAVQTPTPPARNPTPATSTPAQPGQTLQPVHDPSLGQVVRRHFDFDPVPGADADEMRPDPTAQVCQHDVPIEQSYPEHGVGQHLGYRPLEFNRLFFGRSAMAFFVFQCAVLDRTHGREFTPWPGPVKLPKSQKSLDLGGWFSCQERK